jgi:DNA-directed RNA polymerase specialized sigma24 family protein
MEITMTKPELNRDPYLDEGMRGFIHSTARKEFWRVASWYELDDLVQDGYMCYYKCRDRYGVLSVKNHPSKADKKWMMSLVKTTFLNHVRHKLAGKMRYGHEVPVSQLGAPEAEFGDIWDSGIIPPQSEEATLAAMVAQAPYEIKQLMCLLAGDGAEVLGFKRSRNRATEVGTGKARRVKQGRRPIRETTNAYYCRVLGLNSDQHDLLKMVRDYFNGKKVNAIPFSAFWR